MRHRTKAFHEALRNDLAHSRELNTRAFACLNRRRRLRFSFCAATVGEHGYGFRGSAHVGSVTRPSGPVPFTLERLTPSPAAIRRATADAFTPASSGFSLF